MILYLDTSSLVKLYVEEAGAGDVRALVRDADVVTTSVLAYPEARATFNRRRRERLATAAEHRAVVDQFDTDWHKLVAITFSDTLAIEAGRLADRHGIRGGDATHLASFAVLVAGTEDDEVVFSSADERLTRAARALR